MRQSLGLAHFTDIETVSDRQLNLSEDTELVGDQTKHQPRSFDLKSYTVSTQLPHKDQVGTLNTHGWHHSSIWKHDKPENDHSQ